MPNRRGAPLSEPVVRATQVDFPRNIALKGLKGLLSGLGIFFISHQTLHSRSLTVRPWKMVVGRRSVPFGKVTFQGIC